ncbi:ABC-type transport auxiliary lipoprotein family protein [uncultured Alsobacter sp.]|uniref:ABC-type transport auxiliary lipoprotein family protein n=1 Tax=uncultured Alsobacter sp. TaxID=1748258 RepID=UPI0025F2C342|nr:ABC-type transport auxiliary lipoprotein family protein [uncultured Alsobacter sp.]
MSMIPATLDRAKRPQKRPRATLLARACAVAVLLGLAGCGSFSPPPETFDLSLPSASGTRGAAGRLIVVSEPQALQALESDRIVVRSGDGTLSFLPGVQWSDRLPRLLQSRIVQGFENAGRAVGRPGTGLAADAAIQSELRFFGVSTAGETQAVIELSAKLVNGSGKIVSARIFRATAPLAAVDGKAAAAALDQATGKLIADMVRWTGGR